MEVVLLGELQSAQLDQRYAEAIARSRWGKSVNDLVDRQFKQLLITVKNRVRSKRRKMEAAAA